MRRQRRLRRQAMVNFAVVIAVLIGAGFLFYNLSQTPDYDEQTLCVLGEGIPPHTAVLLDKTDNYSRRQADRIASLVRRTSNDLEVGERFTLFELDERGRMDEDGAFSMCNPGRGDQTNALYRNPRIVQERYAEQFEGPLNEIMDGLISPREAPRSPVVEAIARLAQTEAFGPDAPERRVVVISDMLQNSDTFSIYGGGGSLPANIASPVEVAEAIERQFGRRYRGVEVEVRLIPRERYEDLQRGALRDYWETLFSELGMPMTWRDL